MDDLKTIKTVLSCILFAVAMIGAGIITYCVIGELCILTSQ
jgi:hypothetical protein